MKTKRITLNAQLETRLELRLYHVDGRAEIVHGMSDPDIYYGVNLPDSFNHQDAKALSEKAKSKTKLKGEVYRIGANKHSDGEIVFAYQVFLVTRIVDDRSSFGHKNCESEHTQTPLTEMVFTGGHIISREEMKKESAWVRTAGRVVDKLPRHHEDWERMQAEFEGRKVNRSTPHAVSLALKLYPKHKFFIKAGEATFAALNHRKAFQPWN